MKDNIELYRKVDELTNLNTVPKKQLLVLVYILYSYHSFSSIPFSIDFAIAFVSFTILPKSNLSSSLIIL